MSQIKPAKLKLNCLKTPFFQARHCFVIRLWLESQSFLFRTRTFLVIHERDLLRPETQRKITFTLQKRKNNCKQIVLFHHQNRLEILAKKRTTFNEIGKNLLTKKKIFKTLKLYQQSIWKIRLLRILSVKE